MKLTVSLLFAVICTMAVVNGLPTKKDEAEGKKAARTNFQNKPCIKPCDLENYKPICAGEGKDKPKSFGSLCVLDNYNCEHGSNLKKVSDGECPGGGGIRLA